MKSEMVEVYEPAEDSYLMSETLSKELPKLLTKNPSLNFLEIGCGSGINLEAAEKAGVVKKNITGTDVNKKAVENCNSLGFNSIYSNLFDEVEGKFDVIVFNPPYLPKDKSEPKSSRLETTGGEKGNEIVLKFLKQAKGHLTKEGRIFVITSSLSPDVNFVKEGYQAKEVASKKLFFEKLSVWECLKV